MDDIKPGFMTTEYKLTLIAQGIGVVLEGVAGILATLQAGGIGSSWIPGALVVLGVVLQIVSLLGYQSSRTQLKVAAIGAGAVAALPASPP